MQLDDFDFNLPSKLIAQYPQAERSASRLLCLDRKTGAVSHHVFSDLPNFLTAKDLLVLNDTKVIPARLFGTKSTSGKIEVLVERVLDDKHVLAHVRANKSLKIGDKLNFLKKTVEAEVMVRQADLFELRFLGDMTVSNVLESMGHVPLPPYINRPDEILDKERYQTVYAKHRGAVAAPTAGLHFDEILLKRLQENGIKKTFVTLHVGAGTFQPVRVSTIKEHRIHKEYVNVSKETCENIRETRSKCGRIVAVGTTAVRSIETASSGGEIRQFQGDTDIFIYPGYQFHYIDALVTNFHLPRSTLLMLVCAFAGYENIINAYEEAVREQYRFFSYGDAMLIV